MSVGRFPAQPWWHLLLPVALVALVFATYLPGAGGGFVFDDHPNIVANEALHVRSGDWASWTAAAFSSPSSALQRPLAMVSFAANHYFTGLDPAPMKLTNIAIHALNALLVLWLARRLMTAVPATDARRRWAATLAAGAWALHPINLMAVLLVVQRMESLSHLFVFAGLAAYLHGRLRLQGGRPGWAWILLGLGAGTGLGMLAKESAALLPLYATCAEACLFRFRSAGAPGRDRKLVALHLAATAVPVAAGLAWMLHKGLASTAWEARGFGMGERLLTEARVLVDYLCWTLLPSLRELSLYHDGYTVSRGLWSPPGTLAAVLVLCGVTALAVVLRRRRPLVSLGLYWFLSAQLLTATFLPLELAFEHRNYFASFGLVLVLADLLVLAPRPALANAAAAAAVLFLVGCAATTHLRAREWSDPYRFAASEAAKQPASPRATYAWGRALVIRTGYHADSPLLDEAFAALEAARRAPDSNILPEQGLLLLAARSGRAPRPEWWTGLQRKLRERPPGPQEVAALAALVECMQTRDCTFPPGQVQAAFAAALTHGPHPDVLSVQGAYLLNVIGDTQGALRMWREVVDANRDVARYRINLARLLIALDRDDEARAQIVALRGIGRFGQNRADAERLHRRLEAANAAARASSMQ